MTIKEIISKYRIYNQDELEKMTTKELVNVMKTFSLKHTYFRKDLLIKDITKYQQHIAFVESKLKNNPMENYHRGTVQYLLPTLIIFQIIRFVWHNDIDLGTHNTCFKYRWVLSIAMVSKQIFHQISSMFNRLSLLKPGSSQSIAYELMNSIINPFSVVKNITNLTIPLETFNQFTTTYKSTFSPVELGLIFNSVRKFNLIHNEEQYFKIKHCNMLINYMPNLESLSLNQIKINNIKVFELLKVLPNLTSLDISNIRVYKIRMPPDSIRNSIRKLKLQVLFDRNYNILSNNTQLETLSVVIIGKSEINFIQNQLNYITKLIVWFVQFETIKMLLKLLCSPQCKVRTLYTSDKHQWVSLLLENNNTIETLDIGSDLSTTINVASKSKKIKRIIFHNHFRFLDLNRDTNINKASGYAIVKSKYRPITKYAIGPFLTYAKKIYKPSENHIDNNEVEETYPNLQFLYCPQ